MITKRFVENNEEYVVVDLYTVYKEEIKMLNEQIDGLNKKMLDLTIEINAIKSNVNYSALKEGVSARKSGLTK